MCEEKDAGEVFFHGILLYKPGALVSELCLLQTG